MSHGLRPLFFPFRATHKLALCWCLMEPFFWDPLSSHLLKPRLFGLFNSLSSQDAISSPSLPYTWGIIHTVVSGLPLSGARQGLGHLQVEREMKENISHWSSFRVKKLKDNQAFHTVKSDCLLTCSLCVMLLKESCIDLLPFISQDVPSGYPSLICSGPRKGAGGKNPPEQLHSWNITMGFFSISSDFNSVPLPSFIPCSHFSKFFVPGPKQGARGTETIGWRMELPLWERHTVETDKYAAAAAKSLQSCLTLYDPIDGSPPGSPVPGILQARTLEWVAISFSNA